MGSKSPSLVELVGALGEGWAAFVGTAERGASRLMPGVSVGIGGEPSPDLNWVVAYGPDGIAGGVRRGVELLRERGLPGTVFAAGPAAAAAATAATALGLSPAGSVPVMCAHATDVVCPETAVDVGRVVGMEGMLAAGDVLGDAFEMPVDWCQRLLGVGFAGRSDAEMFLATHDGRPVAAAGAAQIGRVACIYAVGTRHSHRRRGAGAAAVSAALDHHLRAGAHWFGLFSAPSAEQFYSGLGFVTVDHAAVWEVAGV